MYIFFYFIEVFVIFYYATLLFRVFSFQANSRPFNLDELNVRFLSRQTKRKLQQNRTKFPRHDKVTLAIKKLRKQMKCQNISALLNVPDLLSFIVLSTGLDMFTELKNSTCKV